MVFIAISLQIFWYFHKSFSEIFIEWSSTKHMILVLNLIGCHGSKKAKLAKNIKKSTPQKVFCR